MPRSFTQIQLESIAPIPDEGVADHLKTVSIQGAPGRLDDI
jgi:hypothetical protein